MFSDAVIVKVGDESVKVRRLTLKEIREDREILAEGDFKSIDEHREKLIAEHVTMADGSPIKPEDLSLPQMQQLMKELVGIPGEGGLSDFIGLLC